MPYVKKNKKKTYKRRNKRKNRNTVSNVRRTLSVGFPKTTMVKLRYVEAISINPGTGTIGQYGFRANSCFDPNLSGIGHQPNGFDQWAVFYNHYIVVGARMKATFSIAGTTAAAGMNICGINLSDDASATTDVSLMMEQSLTKTKKAYFSVNAGRPITITKNFSAKKFFNITNIRDNWDRLGAPITDNPTEVAFFIPFCGSPDVLVDPPEISVLIEIEYITLFAEPKLLAQS